MKIQHFLPLLLLATIAACSGPNDSQTDPKTFKMEFDKSKVKDYRAIVDSLNNYGYVPLYRFFQTVNFDFKNWNINSDPEKYLSDSVSYYSAHETFFAQNRDFLHWLMNFQHDTIVDTTAMERTLWMPFTNPYSSNLSPCRIFSSKSSQAISLIYGFLDGKDIRCVECDYGSQPCTQEKYESVKTFLKANPDLSIAELRKKWKPNL